MIRVGIAGIGYIAEEYIKLFSQGKIKNAELHALSSRNYAHMEEIKNTYHLTDATLFSDYNAMLASSGIDMVIVCTPHFCHPDMAIRSIERGIHTLIEKPASGYTLRSAVLSAWKQSLHKAEGIDGQRFHR